MNIIDTPIPGLYLFQPQAIADNRGFFAEVFTQRELSQIGHTKPIIQVNHSKNVQQGTLRGMHFQYPPHAEIKIIKCIRGAIYDVAVDIRQGSPTFLQWHAHQLSEENMTLFYIPEG
ncbi:MAG: dTDP-4-dehydrorhamnose 3,5-epimerase family protein, partial [bacterium]|nr:dTDP-4-dehydrorhamnose 3,5-epimerase family protein [bacterium]